VASLGLLAPPDGRDDLTVVPVLEVAPPLPVRARHRSTRPASLANSARSTRT
jgi:hypothetical protein